MYLVIEKDADDARYMGVCNDLNAAKDLAQDAVDSAYDDAGPDFDTTLYWDAEVTDRVALLHNPLVTSADDPAASVTYEIAWVHNA